MAQEQDPEWSTQVHPYESAGGKVSWILNKGMRLGKGILIAGFVVSTAPVVIPPLMVVSGIGIAVSLPYGLYLACYACTEKLMDKFLPIATTIDRGQPQGEEYGGGPGQRYLGDSVMDVNKDENQKMDEAEIQDDFRIESAAPKPEVGSNLGEGSEGSARGQSRMLEYGTEQYNHSEEGSKSDETSPFDSEKQDKVDMGMVLAAGDFTGESLLTGAQGIVITVEEDGEENGNNAEELETPYHLESVTVDEFSNRNAEGGIKETELERETKGLLEKIREKGKAEMPEREMEPIKPKMDLSEDDKAKGTVKSVDVDSREGEEGKQLKEEEATRERMDAGDTRVGKTQIETSESDKSRAGRKAGKNRKKSHKSSKEKSHAKQIDAGHVLSEKAETESIASSAAEKSEGSSKTDERPEEVMALPESGDLKSKTGERDAGKGSIDSPSNEAIFSREKVWEKIDAMRIIVGYKGTRHASFVEELKALYVFTGVEPPASFRHDSSSDLVDVSHKLRYLMSIVGIK